MSRLGIGCLSLGLLALPALAHAQASTPAPAPAPAQEPAAVTQSGTFSLGGRGTSLSGDAARYERYRDLSDGLFLEGFRWNRQSRTWVVSAAADHVGRKDQRFSADVVRPGKLKAWLLWDQIPMIMSDSTRTLFAVDQPGVLTIDNGIQAQAQATPASLGPLFTSNATVFPLSSKRHIARGGVEYLMTPDWTLRANVAHTRREGTMPFGGSFGHSALIETPAPIEHSLIDVDAGAEFSRDRYLFRAGYTGSFFHNDVTSLTFDNPFRAEDATSESSRGRISLAPSNSFIGVNGMGSVKLPGRTRVTASLAVGSLSDSGDALLPHTINGRLAAIPLERATVDGEARTTSVNLSMTSRPMRRLDLSLRYRSYDYDNRTPEFTITQRVAYDNSVSTLTAPKHTEPYSVARHTLDADVRVTPFAGATAGIGFTRLDEDRTHRIFETITDNTIRLTFDLPSQQWFTLRTKFEHGKKRGEGDPATIAAELAAVGEQPGMRHFDIASRDRNRVTVLGSLMPADNLMLTMSVAAGKDDYAESLFGLRDNTHRVYSIGLNATPAEHVVLGGSYEFERYEALSRSRQANPGAQFLDPSRNWAANGLDRAHSILVNGGLMNVAGKVDIELSYDFNLSRSLYTYITGPVADRTLPEEVIIPTTLPDPKELPPVRSELNRGTVDLTYNVSRRIGVGLSYWYEAYRVNDFTLDADSTPDLDGAQGPDLVRARAVLIGYLYRPYTAHTVWGRLVYRW